MYDEIWATTYLSESIQDEKWPPNTSLREKKEKKE